MPTQVSSNSLGVPTTSDGGRRLRKLASSRSFNHLKKTWGIDDEEILKVFDVYYRKPYNNKGQLYIFANYFAFVSKHSTTQVCRSWKDVTRLEVKKGNHSPKQFLFATVSGAPEMIHKIRGSGGQQRRMAATVLLVWQHFNGDTSIDLAQVRADNSYIMNNPGIPALYDGLEAEPDRPEDAEDSDTEADTLSATDEAPGTPTSSSHESSFTADMPKPLVALPELFRSAMSEPKNDEDRRECIVAYGLSKVWALLFSDESTLGKDFTAQQGGNDYVAEPWAQQQGYLERKITYSKEIDNFLVSGTAHITQTQRAAIVSGQLLVYSESATTGIPKGDCFLSKSMFEISPIDQNSSRIMYSCWLDWIKSGGILKGKITSKTIETILSGFESLMAFAEQRKDSVAVGPAATQQQQPTQPNPMALAGTVFRASASPADSTGKEPSPAVGSPATPTPTITATDTNTSGVSTPTLSPTVASASATTTPTATTPTFTMTKPSGSTSKSGGSGGGASMTFSYLEIALMILVAIFACAAFYYRAQARSYAFIIEGQNALLASAANAGTAAGSLVPPHAEL
eukprot:TRINITY_DN1845_c2_g1_i1.p1 TRINITY_DN1845_c2_g1~~TRINITY_DN1845_c2_g1_i1.p1  ORF type:complete len:570 (+),score=86.59 TRINITY_DN1845_c2_g1_i1:301-2010(+)